MPEAAGAAQRCAHCDLPFSGRPSPAPVYCCLGCRLAATVAGGRDGQRQFLEARLLLAAFLSMGVMTFSLVLYGEHVHAVGDEAGLAAVRNLGRMMLALFALPVLLLLGVPLARGAWEDARTGRLRMDGLIFVAAVAAYGLSLHATWSGTGEVYYDTATMVLVLVTFGRRLEAHARTRGRDAAELLAEHLPVAAHRVTADGVEDVDPARLRPGDRCDVRPGEAVPADVVVERGSGSAVLAHVTGEHGPVPIRPGVSLPSGAINGSWSLAVRVERTGSETSLGRIRALLESPVPTTGIMRAVDRWAGWLGALAAALALGGGLWHGRAAGAAAGVEVALSVLLVACPCALGLATPLAYRAMRAALARRGLLVHDAAQLEHAARIDHVALDKTGTITDPASRMTVTWTAGEDDTALLEELLTQSGHALAGAVTRDPSARSTEVRVVPGCGVVARVDARRCELGRPAWLDERGARWPAEARQATTGAGSVTALAVDGAVRAVAIIEQSLRPGAAETTRELRRRVASVEVLSGDRTSAAAPVSEALGVACVSEMRPEDKLERITALQATGRAVLFVGDGINDAPALRAATVGVAMGSGTGAARTQSGMEIIGDDLSLLPALLDGARVLRRTTTGNLFWAVAYNGVALALATAGKLHPLAAVAAMIASSLVVSVRSYRLLDWRPPTTAGLPSHGAVRPSPQHAPSVDVSPRATVARAAVPPPVAVPTIDARSKSAPSIAATAPSASARP